MGDSPRHVRQTFVEYWPNETQDAGRSLIRFPNIPWRVGARSARALTAPAPVIHSLRHELHGPDGRIAGAVRRGPPPASQPVAARFPRADDRGVRRLLRDRARLLADRRLAG